MPFLNPETSCRNVCPSWVQKWKLLPESRQWGMFSSTRTVGWTGFCSCILCLQMEALATSLFQGGVMPTSPAPVHMEMVNLLRELLCHSDHYTSLQIQCLAGGFQSELGTSGMWTQISHGPDVSTGLVATGGCPVLGHCTNSSLPFLSNQERVRLSYTTSPMCKYFPSQIQS